MRATASLVVLLAICSPALAQRDDNERFGRPLMTPDNLADMSLGRFAFCAEARAQATAAKVLQTRLASDEEAKQVRKLAAVNRECSPLYPMPFTPTAVRNALATIAYRRNHKSGDVPPPTPAGTPPPASFAVVPADANGTDQQQGAWYLGAIANCVVFVDPPAVHRLVTGPIDVPEEDKRFAALVPAIGRCSPSDTSGLTVRRFRGYLANALLQHVGDGAKMKD
ncbi:hypothetical protein [uncultured Sphingomonas sp.]|uniref:hypothetical protein n=1 Tax=uncultured Sphingomonas sp. TaxID=158754 RepID=UPI0035CBCC8A